MDAFYDFCKGFVDPVFIVFVLLMAALIICFISSKKKDGVLILGLAVLLLYGGSIVPVANYLAYSLEKEYFQTSYPGKEGVDVIVVLGGGANNIAFLNKTYATEASAARLLHAVEVFHKHGAKYIVCAGKGSARVPEGEIMAHMASTLGVPKEKILIDAKSNNTWEHAVELNKIFTDKNIRVGVVTSAYHMKRSEREFKKYFKNVVPLPASYLYSSPAEKNMRKYIPQTAALQTTATALKEIIGLLWYKIKNT